MLVSEDAIADILVCPACRKKISTDGDGASRCSDISCRLGGQAFAKVAGQSVLIDFTHSILEREQLLQTAGSSVLPRNTGWRDKIQEWIYGVNVITPSYSRQMITDCQALAFEQDRRPRMLVIGGGAIGRGCEELYLSAEVDVISTDIYHSANTSFLADAHALPLADDSIDGVWIQSVLEHVLDPSQVVAEIKRVLRSDGLLFMDGPFLWPVHERAWDFTRWTASGYRWLLRDFSVIGAGYSSGPGTVAMLAIRQLLASLTGKWRVAQLLALPINWLRYLDRLCDARWGMDGAAGYFLYCRKSERPITPRELVMFYDEQIELHKVARKRWR